MKAGQIVDPAKGGCYADQGGEAKQRISADGRKRGAEHAAGMTEAGARGDSEDHRRDRLSSGGRSSPLGDQTIVGPFAVIVPSELDTAPMAGFADNALPIFVPASQCEGVDLPPIDLDAPASQDRVKQRLEHISWKIEGGALPPCRVVGLPDASEPLADAIQRAGADDTDLDALPLLCLPLWALNPFDRVAVEARLAAIAR